MARQLTYRDIDRIDHAVAESGLELLEASDHRPRQLRVRFPGTNNGARLCIYVWAIRGGGGGPGVRPDDERRVQTTRPGDADFVVLPGWATLLLGYDPAEDLYAAWSFELRRWTRQPPGHPSGPPVGSPSAQTRQSALDNAQRTGIAFHAHDVKARRRNGTKVSREELVANFRPDHFGTYLSWLDVGLAPAGTSPAARAAQRRRISTVRLARDARFTKEVVTAYGGRCCFCGLGAGVIEAAHVKPVSDGGPDMITNGVALCPTHHRLFDKGYLLVRPSDLGLEPNHQKMAADNVPARDRARVAGGINATPTWPASIALRPEARFVRRHRKLHR